MIIVMFACSEKAYLLMQEVKERWIKIHSEDEIILLAKCRALPQLSSDKSLAELAGEWFEKADALVFVCAAGIAVRSIAPYLEHKSKDPAVLVMDEKGRFCISLLSGHAGGANELAGQLSELFKDRGTIPVITTATDMEGKFAVDDFARRNHLLLKDWQLAKMISVQILQGERIRFMSDFPVCGEMPEELEYIAETQKSAPEMEDEKKEDQHGIRVSFRKSRCFSKKQLQLTPTALVVGIGCRKDTPEVQIERAVNECFREEGLLPDGIAAFASIDLKKQEKGILAYCEKRKLPFFVYSKEELAQVEGVFTASVFVEEVTGVDNVCERSAVLGAFHWSREKTTGGRIKTEQEKTEREKQNSEKEQKQCVRLITGKKCYDKVTIAVAAVIEELYF